MTNTVVPSRYFRWHGIVNRLVGVVLLILTAPVILISLALVWLTSRGNPLYRQNRVGKCGRVFTIYKIRSMRLNAEARTGAVWTTNARDPRITRIGRFLRASHLDELPQLWNVVRGEMALVGPRPERPEFTEALADEIDGYLDRLHVLPGVTGLAQVNLPPDVDLDSVRRKLILDLKYVTYGSFWLDLRIVFATLLAMCGIPARIANRILWLEVIPQIASGAEHCVRNEAGLSEHSHRHSNPHAEAASAMHRQ